MLSLGIDTSNYKTSLSLVNTDGEIIYNYQQFLDVPKGMRGLRQSDAFFQHVNRLDIPIREAMKYRKEIGVVCVSSRPRPVDGSYMPCFLAGLQFAKTAAMALDIPYFETSHQEGHIEAVKYYSELKSENRFICFHFSGGTTEAVLADSGKLEIVGGTKDISYGQVIDRIGVRLGFDFPAGKYLDEIAIQSIDLRIKQGKSAKLLKPLKSDDGFLNLSGIETQGQRAIDELNKGSLSYDDSVCLLCGELFDKIGKSIIDITVDVSKKCNEKKFLFAGGVSSSNYIRQYIKQNMPKDIEYCFGRAELSTDNAVGTALIGGKKYGIKAGNGFST